MTGTATKETYNLLRSCAHVAIKMHFLHSRHNIQSNSWPRSGVSICVYTVLISVPVFHKIIISVLFLCYIGSSTHYSKCCPFILTIKPLNH